MSTGIPKLDIWIGEVRNITQSKEVYLCEGSKEEYRYFVAEMVKDGTFQALNDETHPDCLLHRSDSRDVARTEDLTYVCTQDPENAGPNNNWMDPGESHSKMNSLFRDSMKGRTMYVIPYIMGPLGSPISRAGVEITDSPYVMANMHKMTRAGMCALKHIYETDTFVKGWHSIGDLDPSRRFIMHYPEEGVIKSFGSGYGGNALLSKKCHALRIASWQGRQEGWLAEHMALIGVEDPQGRVTYMAAAFPSGCGKTNLAMLKPSGSYSGWKVWTVGDDIVWMYIGGDGRLWAINPEAGFFGIAPGTNMRTNPNMMEAIASDTIFTNVAETVDHKPWWEGVDGEKPEVLIDWQGRLHNPLPDGEPAAHPNSRFTVSLEQCPSISSKINDSKGVPISAIIFGGRRPRLMPLVYEAFSWEHGVFAGATMASETTTAATGKTGVLRRDPMAMLPFCGYNMADYWDHWLSFSKRANSLPKVFHVNWFQEDEGGNFIWPGFGENIRVLEWIASRCRGEVQATYTPVGLFPNTEDINMKGLGISCDSMDQLFSIDETLWNEEMRSIEKFFTQFGSRLPKILSSQIHLFEL